MKAGLLGLLLPLGICAAAVPAAASGTETVYSLYRSSFIARDKRVHVATFDAQHASAIAAASTNSDNCNRVARALNEQPGSGSKHWCERGRHRRERTQVLPPPPVLSRARLRRDSTLTCNSAVAARTSTPEDLAVACTGWSALAIARAELRFLSGMCKADSIQDCDRLCFHAPAALPRSERTDIVDWACRRRSEIVAQNP